MLNLTLRVNFWSISKYRKESLITTGRAYRNPLTSREVVGLRGLKGLRGLGSRDVSSRCQTLITLELHTRICIIMVILIVKNTWYISLSVTFHTSYYKDSLSWHIADNKRSQNPEKRGQMGKLHEAQSLGYWDWEVRKSKGAEQRQSLAAKRSKSKEEQRWAGAQIKVLPDHPRSPYAARAILAHCSIPLSILQQARAATTLIGI